MNNVIFSALLLAVGIGLVSADFTCPDGIVTCSEGKACCFQSGSGYSCCDKPDDDADLIPGTLSSWQPFPNQSLPSAASPFDYCPYTSGRQICCIHGNCMVFSECCESQLCCMSGYRCCSNGQWCCERPKKCGPYFNTCRNGAGAIEVQGLAVMVAVALAALKFARI